MQKRRKNRSKQKQGHTLNKALPEPPKPDVPQSTFSSDAGDMPSSDKHPDAERLADGSGGFSRPKQEPSGLGRETLHPSAAESKDNTTLPASTYKRVSQPPSLSAAVYDPASELDGFYVPVVLDPNPAAASPATNGRDFSDSTNGKDKYASRQAGRPSRDYLNDKAQSSRSSSTERKPAASPHIAFQDKGRQSDHIVESMRKRGASQTASPRTDSSTPSTYSGQSDFKLQDAPKMKKSGSGRSTKSDNMSPPASSHSETVSQGLVSSPTDADPKDGFERSPGAASRRDRGPMERPRRGDSLGSSTVQRKEVAPSASALQHISELGHDRKASVGSIQLNGGMTISNPIESPGLSKSIFDAQNGSSAATTSSSGSDAFTAPRMAPPPPATHRPSESNSTAHSEGQDSGSPIHLPRYTWEEDKDEGVLRKMSQAIKGHTRSVSDRVVPSPRSQKHPWPKSPVNGSVDLGSPASPEGREDLVLRSQLRRAQQRIAELETEKTSLQTIVNGSSDMTQVNSALKEKRSTMAMLDTQREIVVRELEIMTDHLKRAKDGKTMDLDGFKTEVLGDFVGSMGKLKDSLSSEIEALMQRRNALADEISGLIQLKDKSFHELETLTARNSQLTQHNNEMIQNIQEMVKAGKQGNGLGLYLGATTFNREADTLGSDLRQRMLDSSTTFTPEADTEPAVITTPHVVKLKQQKPNMLRKGGFGKTLRGIKGALTSERDRTPTYTIETGPYGQDTGPGAPRSAVESRKFGGLFGGGDKGPQKHMRMMQNNSNPNLVDPSQTRKLVVASRTSLTRAALFGSDLAVRCAHENRDIPSIVIRCVQEVELRGMDVEGVYRKSGGSGQVNLVKAGFEKNDDYDVSDPDLEIHAVTSCLKQYFRRLPVPLITFDVYDTLLDAARTEDREKRATRMREAVQTLPRSHRLCLEFLIFHLARVTAHEKDNLVCFARVSLTLLTVADDPS
jgi:hypothetical protein